MSIEIKRIDEDTLSIQGKLIIRDMNGNWIARNLNQQQTKVAENYIATLDN